jgi:hypothetical protein
MSESEGCKSCRLSYQNGGSCLETLGFDGYYTWGTPLQKSHYEDYGSWEPMDNSMPPDVGADGKPNCFAFAECPEEGINVN